MQRVTVRVPATTANLGPGFDCLGLAVDLWNTTTFSFGGSDVRLRIKGEGRGVLPEDEDNRVYKAFMRTYSAATATRPQGILIECDNHIPIGSGMGSSAAATIAGLIGGNTLLGKPLDTAQILRIASEIEGHPDNAAAALLGGLTVVLNDEDGIQAYPIECGISQVVVVLPDCSLSTPDSRAVLPGEVPLGDVIYNLGRSVMVVEGMRTGNFEILSRSMVDRLHQPYRLKLIPGASEAIQAAKMLAAPAVLSGAGPAVVAFPPRAADDVRECMCEAFEAAGLKSRSWVLNVTSQGANSDVE
jgi:homoserine kinase